MLKTLIKKSLLFFPWIILFAWIGPAHAYRVSGSVDFTYSFYKTKAGGNVSSDQMWSHTYNVGLSDYLIDRRAIQYSASVGYSELDSKRSSSSNALDYNLQLSLFPGMRVSSSLYAHQSFNRVPSNNNISGMVAQTRSTGAAMYVRLSRGASKGNNNNNNNNKNDNNNNNNDDGDNNDSNNSKKSRGRFAFSFPDISITHDRSETETQSMVNPLHTSTEDSKAQLYFRPHSDINVTLGAGLKKYNDMTHVTSYDEQTFDLGSNYKISNNSHLMINGLMMEGSNRGFAVNDTHTRNAMYNMALNVQTDPKISQNYRYYYQEQDSTGIQTKMQQGTAGVGYALHENIRLNSTLGQGRQEYLLAAQVNLPEQKGVTETTTFQTGAAYNQRHTPGFMGSFAVVTMYSFNVGYANTTYSSSINTPLPVSANGFYYVHDAGLDFVTTDWQQESLSVGGHLSRRRDHSALPSDADTNTLRMSYSSTRLAKTIIRIAADYNEYESLSAVITPLNESKNSYQQGHATTYNLSVDHHVSGYLALSSGAARGRATSSTITEPFGPSLPSLEQSTWSMNDSAFASANYTYPISRILEYRLSLREEYLKSPTYHSQASDIDMNLNYRINRIFVSLQFRWREDMPSNAQRSQQELLFARLSRPF